MLAGCDPGTHALNADALPQDQCGKVTDGHTSTHLSRLSVMTSAMLSWCSWRSSGAQSAIDDLGDFEGSGPIKNRLTDIQGSEGQDDVVDH